MTERDDFRTLLNERHDVLIRRLDELQQDATTVVGMLREQNGRIGRAESRLAVLEERNPGKQGGMWGTVGGAVSGFLAGLLK